ncbi:hypothetical protein PICMEDRAFT_74611 [Pichia membranifaciens NRRL Y-2026]|uniref:Zn(2)-C6 fungal-type domain-containing protein n=1 Tax=Pichia membranifaciens NRRL Y-2026 TaxID=763406 RepID=A0A1E3NE07_9ASCO|nr:hypothetical protein PICMEDRAFT_74611 [Pichia membranifaciens NRRL Y-2026]ODQ44365.1 hypothetical protein PICMEDRAFT_74611 [Pichia membranifaciens NRRL Y-2026]
MAALKKRTGHKYSHSGCTNCKKRSIKCDENFPECLACQKKNLKCEYKQKIFVYQPFKTSSKQNKKFKKIEIDHLSKEPTSTYVPEAVGSFDVIDKFIDEFKENFDQGRQSNISGNKEEQILECKKLDELSASSALQVASYVRYWKPYTEERYQELFEKLDATGAKSSNVHYHENDPEVQEFILHAFVQSKATYNYILAPAHELSLVTNWVLHFGTKYPIMGYVLNFITCNLLDIKCSDDRWSCILKRNMATALINLSARVGQCDSFIEMVCYLFSIMFLFSEQTASRQNVWRLHLRGAFAILEQCSDLFNKVSQNKDPFDSDLKLALQMFSFSKNWFVAAEIIACLSAPNGGVIKDIYSSKFYLGYNTQELDDGVLLGGFNLMKGYSQLLSPVVMEIITFMIAFKKSEGISLSGTRGLLENLPYSEERRILGQKLLARVKEVQTEELNLSTMQDHVMRAYIRSCNKCFCYALQIYISSIFLDDFIYGDNIQHCVQIIEEQLVTSQDIRSYGLSIHWPLFVASLCALSANQRLTFIKALKNISSNGTFVARNTVERVERFWKVIDSGGLIEEEDYDCTVA